MLTIYYLIRDNVNIKKVVTLSTPVFQIKINLMGSF